MTHWLEFGEADFDAARAAGRPGKRSEAQDGLFFVPTPVRPPKGAAAAAQLPGQAPLFGPDEADGA